MSEIFRIEGNDKRQEFVARQLKWAQKVSGKKVEYFRPDIGFVLLRKDGEINYDQSFVQRARSAAELSLGVPLELREFYYTLRTNPVLVKDFEGIQPKALYPAVLRAIMDTEIICDIHREVFTVGNLSKGFIYYFHNATFGNKIKKIAFTENIARTLKEDPELDLSACQNIIVIEKNAAATRLVDLGFSELTNSVIVTVGGNFNRAVWELTKQFKDDKHLIFLADADAYGVDMLRTIRVGTKSSRHLDYKFPPSQNSRIHLSGLYPSIGEKLELPNDEEQKRPLQNPYVRKRIGFLRKYGLLNEKDYESWMRDKTYELESLSAAFKNAKGEPVGLAIYLIEYMRHYGIPVKPPLPPDDELEEQFREKAKEELKSEIEAAVTYPRWFWELYYWLNDKKVELSERIFEEMLPDYETTLEKVTAKEIKYHIYKQFAREPGRATYDLREIAHKLKKEFSISVDWSIGPLEEAIQEVKDEDVDVDYKTNYRFEAIHNESFTVNEYDLALQRLGADEEDVVKVRHAIEWRFS